MSDLLLRLMRPLARLGEKLAPGLTGRIAFRLFCTPPRPKQGNHRAASVKSLATRLEAGTPLSVPFPCGSVAAHLFEPLPRAGIGTPACVILLHGWTGQAAVMAAFVKPLLEAGLRVVAFDLPAHGDSTGATLDLPTGVASLAAVARAVGPIEAIVAHSFGGSIALAALAGTLPAQPRVVAKRLVLIAPPLLDAGGRRLVRSPHRARPARSASAGGAHPCGRGRAGQRFCGRRPVAALWRADTAAALPERPRGALRPRTGAGGCRPLRPAGGPERSRAPAHPDGASGRGTSRGFRGGPG